MNNDSMNNNQEAFSAFVDNELSSAERNEQINDTTNDVNLRYKLQRYHIIGDVMRGEASDKVPLDFAAQVSARIAQLEPVTKTQQSVECPKQKNSLFAQWFKPMSGLAIAASVAWVAVISVQGVIDTETISNTDQLAQVKPLPQSDVSIQVNRLAQLPVFSSAVPVSSRLPVLDSRSQWSARQSQAVSQAKLNAYLVTHTEYSSSMQGIIPQARVAGFDVSQ